MSMWKRLLSPDNPRSVLVGCVLILLGYFAFSLTDALGKALVVSVSVGQLMAVRAIGSFLVLGPMVYIQKENPFRNVKSPTLQVLRAVLATIDTTLFYAATIYLPLADVMTFYMAGPIYVAVASHFLLGERAGWRRWSAIFVGFVGVVIALRPSSASFSIAALFAIAGSVSYSLALVINKRLTDTADPVLGIYQALAALIGGSLLAAADWRMLSLESISAMLLIGVVGALAHMTVTRSVKLAPVSVLAPFQYTLLLWGIICGIVFFGDIPTPNILAGSAVIILAGLFIVHRKAKVADLNGKTDVPAEVP